MLPRGSLWWLLERIVEDFNAFVEQLKKKRYQGETRSKTQFLTPVQLSLESAEFVDDTGEKIEAKHAEASMGMMRERSIL